MSSWDLSAYGQDRSVSRQDLSAYGQVPYGSGQDRSGFADGVERQAGALHRTIQGPEGHTEPPAGSAPRAMPPSPR